MDSGGHVWKVCSYVTPRVYGGLGDLRKYIFGCLGSAARTPIGGAQARSPAHWPSVCLPLRPAAGCSAPVVPPPHPRKADGEKVWLPLAPAALPLLLQPNIWQRVAFFLTSLCPLLFKNSAEKEKTIF